MKIISTAILGGLIQDDPQHGTDQAPRKGYVDLRIQVRTADSFEKTVADLKRAIEMNSGEPEATL